MAGATPPAAAAARCRHDLPARDQSGARDGHRMGQRGRSQRSSRSQLRIAQRLSALHRAPDCGWQVLVGFLMNECAGPNATAQYKGWPISKEDWDEIFG